jgi:hypothetical protein
MNKIKKRPNEQITLTHAHKDRMMTKEQRQLMGIKIMNKMKKQRQLASCHMKLLEDGLTRDGLKCICHIHL